MIKSTFSSSAHTTGFFGFATQRPASIAPLLFPCGIPIPNPIYVENTSSLAKTSLWNCSLSLKYPSLSNTSTICSIMSALSFASTSNKIFSFLMIGCMLFYLLFTSADDRHCILWCSAFF